MQRTVANLSESIPACHFLVSLKSTSKIQAWLTSYLKLELQHKVHYVGLWKTNTTIEVSELQKLWQKLWEENSYLLSWTHRVQKKKINKVYIVLFSKTQFPHLCTSTDFKEFENKLSLFIQERCSQFPTFVFWMSYLNMADYFLNSVRAKRIGNWALHLQSAAEMLPWYFAYNHLNYVRYLPVYIYELLAIPDIHPSIEEYLAAGIFVVQQQNQYSFSQTSMD